MHSLCMLFQPLILGCSNMRFLLNTKTTKMFLKRKMQTHYLNISHMIVQLIWRKECNLRLDPSITCHNMNSRHFENNKQYGRKRSRVIRKHDRCLEFWPTLKNKGWHDKQNLLQEEVLYCMGKTIDFDVV
jgi:hypothetical protein